jgi:hypothetical protein
MTLQKKRKFCMFPCPGKGAFMKIVVSGAMQHDRFMQGVWSEIRVQGGSYFTDLKMF